MTPPTHTLKINNVVTTTLYLFYPITTQSDWKPFQFVYYKTNN